MSQQIAASVYMITLNEEKNVAESLASVADFAEVIIVDSGSTDRTLAIAQGFPNVRVFHNDWPGFSEQKAYAMSLCSQPWVFNLDADELPTPDFLDEGGAYATLSGEALPCAAFASDYFFSLALFYFLPFMGSLL